MKWTVKNSNLRSGDILLSFGGGWLSKAICKFMHIYRKKLGIPVRTVYSHASGIIEVWGEIYVVEATSKGVIIRKFEDSYAGKLNKVKLLTPKKIYSKKEHDSYCRASQELTFKSTEYDFLNFLYQIDMILRTKDTLNENWEGPTGKKAIDRLYCSEAVATLANIVRAQTFEKPWATNPLDLDLNKYYKEKIVKHD